MAIPSTEFDWITNDPVVAKRLETADQLHADARFHGRNLPLKEKLDAYRKADRDRALAYRDILDQIVGEEARDAGGAA